MSKFFTSVFLIAAMLVSGLSSLTSSIPASATLANPIDCSFAGMYKDRTETGSPCRPCPVDFVCKLIINSKGDRVSPEKPGKDGKIDSEVVPCPAGSSTKGYTLHPALGTLLTKDQDGFVVGTMATDPSMCKKPDFKCPTESPILVQDVNGELKCFANCPTNEAAIIFEGVQTCGIKCRDNEVATNKKCFKQCGANEVLSSRVGQEAKCVSICLASSIQGQIPNEVGSCVCPVGKSVILDSLNSNTGKCGVPVPCPIEGQIKSGEGVCFCEPPRTLSGDKKTCDLPVEPCGRNTFGTSKPNCKPCPEGSRALIGQAITMDDCVFDPCGIAGQTRIAGKCQCSAGKIVNPDQTICITPEVPCTATGQVKTFNGVCVCPESKALSNDGKSCEPIAVPCGINTYGANKPNCKPCPIGSRAAAGTAATAEDCNYDPCTISGQVRTSGKCECPSGTVISTSGYYCEKPSIPCAAKGQIKSGDGECFCPYPTILNSADKVCVAPPALCSTNTYGEAQPNCKPCPKDSKSVAGSKVIQDCVFDPCPAFGQIRKDSVCGCVLPAILNPSGAACEILAIPCKENQYGIKEPNCKPCPANFTSTDGKAYVEKDCVANKCVIPGQIRFYDGNCQCPNEVGYLIVAANNSKSCGQCPTDNTITQAGKEPTGENQFKCNPPVVVVPQKTDGGSSGICGGGVLEVLCYAAGAYLVYDTFTCGGLVTVVQCDSPKPVDTVFTNTSNDPVQPNIGRVDGFSKYKITKEGSGSECSGSNQSYYEQVIVDGNARDKYAVDDQAHDHGKHKFIWVETEVAGSGNSMRTKSFKAAVIDGQSSANPALKCLTQRVAKNSGTQYGSSDWVKVMRETGILHGLNKTQKAECYDMTKLLAYLNQSGNGETQSSNVKYFLKKDNVKIAGPFATQEEAKAKYDELKSAYRGTQLNQATATYTNPYTGKTEQANSNYVGADVFTPNTSNDGYIYNQTTATYDNPYTGQNEQVGSNPVRVQEFAPAQTQTKKSTISQNENDYPIGSNEEACLKVGNTLYDDRTCSVSFNIKSIFEPIKVSASEEGDDVLDPTSNKGASAEVEQRYGNEDSEIDVLELGNFEEEGSSFTNSGNGFSFEGGSGTLLFDSGFGNDNSYPEYTSIVAASGDGYLLTSKNTTFYDDYKNSCPADLNASLNLFDILGTPLKVNALITGDVNSYINTSLNDTSTPFSKTTDCKNVSSYFLGTGESFGLDIYNKDSEFGTNFSSFLTSDNVVSPDEFQKFYEVDQVFAAAQNTKFAEDTLASNEFLLFDNTPYENAPADPKSYDFGNGNDNGLDFSIKPNTGNTYPGYVIEDKEYKANTEGFVSKDNGNLTATYDTTEFDNSNNGYPTANEPTSGSGGKCFVDTGCDGTVKFPDENTGSNGKETDETCQAKNSSAYEQAGKCVLPDYDKGGYKPLGGQYQ